MAVAYARPEGPSSQYGVPSTEYGVPGGGYPSGGPSGGGDDLAVCHIHIDS